MAIKQPGKGVAGRKGGESANTIAADAAAQQPADLLAKTPAVNGAEEQWLAEAADAWEKSRAAEVEEELANQAGERVILLAEAGRDGVGTTLTDAGTGGAAEGGAAAGGAGGAGGAGAAFAATGGLWAPILGGAVLVGAAASGGGGGDGHDCDPINVFSNAPEGEDGYNERTILVGQEGLYGHEVNVVAVESGDVAILNTSEDVVVEFCDEHPAHVHVLAGGDALSGEDGSFAEIVGYSGDSLQAVGTIYDISVDASGDYSRAYALLDLDGKVLDDLVVTAEGGSADAELYLNAFGEDTAVVELQGGNITVLANGDSAYAYAGIGDSYFDVTTSQDVFSVTGTVGSIDVEASSYDSTAALNLVLSGDVTGGIDVGATFYSADANAYVTVDGSISGDLTVTASGEDSDANLYVNADGIVKGVSFGEDTAVVELQGDDITVLANGDSAYAYADIGSVNGDVFSVTGSVGNVSVDAASNLSTAVLNLDLGGDITGSVDVTASGDAYRFTFDEHSSGDIHAYEANADATVLADNVGGDVTVTSDGDYAGAYLSLDVTENVGGGIAVTASGDGIAVAHYGEDWAWANSYAYADVRVGGNVLGDVFVEAGGDGSDAQLDLYVGGDLGGSIDVIASGNWVSDDYSGDYADVNDWGYAWASADVTVDGTISGDLTVTASGVSADAHLYVNADSEDTATAVLQSDDITVTASGEDSWAYAEIGSSEDFSVTGTVGSVDVLASAYSADADLYLTLSGNITGGIDVSATSEDAYAYADLTVEGTISGDITVSASGGYSHANLYVNDIASSTDTAVVALQGSDITVTATGDSSDASADIGDYYYDVMDSQDVFSVTGTVGSIDVVASSYDSSATLNLVLGGDVIGGIDVSATSEDAYAYADLTVEGTISGDITVSASDVSSDAELYINAYGEDTATVALQSGDITVTASGEDSWAYADIGSVSGDVFSVTGTVGAVDVLASAYSADADLYLALSGNITGGIDVSATSEDAYACADVTVDGSISGGVTVTSTGLSADAYLSLDVGGDISGDIDVSASGSDDSAYADVWVSGDVTGGLVVDADGYYSSASADVYVGGDLSGGIDVSASGSYDYASADVWVSGDVSGDVTVTSTGLGADAYLSLDVGGDLNFSIDVVANVKGDHAEAWVSAHSVGDLWVEATAFADQGVSISSSAYLTVDVAISHDINGFDDGSVGDLTVVTGANDYARVEFVDRFSNFVDLTQSSGDSTLVFGVDVDDEDASAELWADAFTTPNDPLAQQFMEDHFMQIKGFEGGTMRGGEDEVFFSQFDNPWDTYSGDYAFESAGSYDFGDITNFLYAADEALGDYTQYFFGVVDGNGYLAVDGNGTTGISYVVEFLGYTSLTPEQLDGDMGIVG